MTRYDEVVTSAQSREELTEGFLAKLEATLLHDARMHRLWYDLRSQAMFEAAFRKDVIEIDKSLEAMIWRIASRYAALDGTRADDISGRALRSVRWPVPERTAQTPRERREGNPRFPRRSQARAADDLLEDCDGEPDCASQRQAGRVIFN